jgi:hypothetical protein
LKISNKNIKNKNTKEYISNKIEKNKNKLESRNSILYFISTTFDDKEFYNKILKNIDIQLFEKVPFAKAEMS